MLKYKEKAILAAKSFEKVIGILKDMFIFEKAIHETEFLQVANKFIFSKKDIYNFEVDFNKKFPKIAEEISAVDS